MSSITADNISVAYDHQTVIESLSTAIPEGKITTIIGSNGCGKSTFLKAITRIQSLKTGKICINAEDISKLKTKEVAKKIALLPQVLETTEGITVYELISYGRFPHQNYLGQLTAHDRSRIHWAMEMTKVTEFANQDVDALSGGQRQRVWIAMALAQDTDTIVLDEPTTYLDMNHQLEILELLQSLNQDFHRTIVMVLHDLNLSARFSDHIIAMKNGHIAYQGTAQQIITAKVIEDIFQIKAQVITDPINHCPVLLSYQLLH